MIRLAFLIGILLPAVLGALERLALPDVELEHPVWAERDPASAATIDHGAWTAFLERYTRRDAAGVVRVDYAAVTAADRAALDRYVAGLEGVDLTAHAPEEQLAYWINLYNAATVRLILEHYPVETIRDIGGGLFEPGPWDRVVATVMGRPLTLDDIEHRIVRAVWEEPRIHYALNCAAVGCPDLARTAYQGATLDARLAAAEAAFVNDPRGIRLEDGTLVLSKIWFWFREDFAEDEAGVLARLRSIAEGRAAGALAGRRAVGRYAYDWRLNDAR
jgi:hypothetical protein